MGKIKDFNKIVFEPFSYRKGDIEAKNYYIDENRIKKSMQSHKVSNFSFFEIVKWQPNPYFGKSFEYDEIRQMYRIGENSWADKKSVHNAESCYMLAHFNISDSDEIIPDLEFCGSRPFELSEEELQIFMNISHICYYDIVEQIQKFIDKND